MFTYSEDITLSPKFKIQGNKKKNYTHFEKMMTTMDEDNSKVHVHVPEEFIFVLFCLFVLLPSSMSRLIHNLCTCMCTSTCKLLITCKITWLQMCMQTNNKFGICFYVLVCILCC